MIPNIAFFVHFSVAILILIGINVIGEQYGRIEHWMWEKWENRGKFSIRVYNGIFWVHI